LLRVSTIQPAGTHLHATSVRALPFCTCLNNPTASLKGHPCMRKQVFAPVCLQLPAPCKGDIPNEL
jgi:hypothetical protein